jgi:hypothetical protein
VDDDGESSSFGSGDEEEASDADSLGDDEGLSDADSLGDDEGLGDGEDSEDAVSDLADEDDESDSEAKEDFAAFVVGLAAESAADEVSVTSEMAFSIKNLASPSAVRQHLRDFGLLNRYNRTTKLFASAPQLAAPGALDPSTPAALTAIVTPANILLMQEQISLATDAMVSMHGQRPKALGDSSAARALLLYAAYTMPACKRVANLLGAPAATRAEVEQAVDMNLVVVNGCKAQVETLMTMAVDAVHNMGNARFILRNTAGAIVKLMEVGRAAGAFDDELLAELRAHAPPGLGRRKTKVRYGRKLKSSVDPVEAGHVKAVIKHRYPLSDEDTKLTGTASLVHHVLEGVMVQPQDVILARFSESTDFNLKKYLRVQAANGFNVLMPTGAYRFSLLSGAEFGIADYNICFTVIEDGHKTEFKATLPTGVRQAGGAFCDFLSRKVGQSPVHVSARGALASAKFCFGLEPAVAVDDLVQPYCRTFRKRNEAQQLVFSQAEVAKFLAGMRKTAIGATRKFHVLHLVVHVGKGAKEAGYKAKTAGHKAKKAKK